jgi:hypothetical protein
MIRVKILLRKEPVKIPGVMSDKDFSGQNGSDWVMELLLFRHPKEEFASVSWDSVDGVAGGGSL